MSDFSFVKSSVFPRLSTSADPLDFLNQSTPLITLHRYLHSLVRSIHIFSFSLVILVRSAVTVTQVAMKIKTLKWIVDLKIQTWMLCSQKLRWMLIMVTVLVIRSNSSFDTGSINVCPFPLALLKDNYALMGRH